MQKMLSYVRRAVDQYHMIEEGDVIAVGVSGGKDSLALLATLANLRRFYPKKFELKAITLEMGYEEMDFTPVAELCKKLDVEYITRQTDIKTIVFDIRQEENPCSLCAKMRRGALNDTAKQCGCNKVALGHHYDDVIETVMMSLLYEGRFNCFLPMTYLNRRDITVIRPMIYAPESYIKSLVRRLELPVVHNPCPADGNTKREEIKQLIRTLEHQNHGVRQRIFGAIQRYPLRGWGIDEPVK
ncbi:MAG: tRNA 2-thiocytidine biosynthesis TtcA family protein [Clostridiales bacterium]|nr:tRNA 2-thiocytidine biosynthesis TtcA family protein [Clostridiales bacterium]